MNSERESTKRSKWDFSLRLRHINAAAKSEEGSEVSGSFSGKYIRELDGNGKYERFGLFAIV